MATVNAPFLSVPVRTIGAILSAPILYAAGTQAIERRLDESNERLARIEQRIDALVGVMQIILAKLTPEWTDDERKDVFQYMGTAGPVRAEVRRLRSGGNPLTQDEIDRLGDLAERAETGERLTSEEATQLRDLADIVAKEYPGEQWVTDLLKLALVAFAVYALSEIFKKRGEDEST